MARPLFLLLAISVLALSACSSNGDNSPVLSGTYTGPYTSFDGNVGTLSLTIPNAISDAVFSWSAFGTVDVGGSDSPVQLSGTGEYVFPNIAFKIPGVGASQSRMLVGTVTGNGTSITASQNTVLIFPGTVETFTVTQ